MNMSYSKKTMIWSLCAALCIVLPMTMRVIPNAYLIYRSMQIPVMLCCILCGPGAGISCALTGAFFSALISGVPAAPLLPVTLTELVLVGLIIGIIVKLFGGRRNFTVVYGIVFAVLTARIVAGIVAACLFSPGSESMLLWAWGYVIAGLPSLLVQLILLPTIIKALEYSGVIHISFSESVRTAECPATDTVKDEGCESAKEQNKEDSLPNT